MVEQSPTGELEPGRHAEANREALRRFEAGDAVLTEVAPAHEVIPALARGAVALTHAGPPIAFENMCGPMRGALAGAAVFEGWAPSPGAAMSLLERGQVTLVPNHETSAIAPMAGVISPSMLTFVIENPGAGTRVATTMNEGIMPGTLRCGANGPEVIERLRWLNTEVLPGVAAAIPARLSLRDLMTQALLMGDELHQRNVAATLLFLKALLPGLNGRDSQAVIAHLIAAPQVFLNLGMAASKAMLDPLAGIAGSTVVTAIARNGVEVGIRVSGTGDRWFTAPAPVPQGALFAGFTPSDANPDIGDSAIVETAGAGGCALVTSPAVHPLVGCKGVDHARSLVGGLREVTVSEHPFFTTEPATGATTRFGFDAARIAASGITPVITTGIAHREAGVGQVGAGIVRPPVAVFAAAAAMQAEMA